MGCQTTVVLADNLTFSICTHDADTGALTDTSAAPAYRIYEDETAAPILNDVMAKLDDANTTGFYTEQIACTAANGFEVGKSYTIYIEATVDGITGGIAYAFTVLAPPGTAAELAKVPKSDSNVTWNATALASVNAEVIDVIRTDALAELAAVPAANASLSAKVNWLFLLARNKRLTTALSDIVRNDADGADVGTAVIGDDGVTFTRGEYA
jgi:hypothetical protein